MCSNKNLVISVKTSNFERRNKEAVRNMKNNDMKRLLFVALFSILMSSCTKMLYSYYDYDDIVFTYAKQGQNMESKDIKKLMKIYEPIVEKPNGENQVPPPGAYADYAYLLFLQDRKEDAKLYFEKECLTYPESKVYIKSFMQKIGL